MTKTSLIRPILLVTLLHASACVVVTDFDRFSEGPAPETDAGTDGGPLDAGTDAGTDADIADAGMDANVDAAADAADAADGGDQDACVLTGEDETSCNQVDDDCDGEVDEDVDFDNDAENCGECFLRCEAPSVYSQASCVAGSCVDSCLDVTAECVADDGT